VSASVGTSTTMPQIALSVVPMDGPTIRPPFGRRTVSAGIAFRAALTSAVNRIHHQNSGLRARPANYAYRRKPFSMAWKKVMALRPPRSWVYGVHPIRPTVGV
jgi:hypothetical protein